MELLRAVYARLHGVNDRAKAFYTLMEAVTSLTVGTSEPLYNEIQTRECGICTTLRDLLRLNLRSSGCFSMGLDFSVAV